MTLDPYKVLGVAPNASIEEVRQAYRRAAAKYHPDAGGDAWAFQQVQQAYDQLRVKHERAMQLESTPPTTPLPSAPTTAKHSSKAKTTRAATQSSTNNRSSSVTLSDWLFGKPLKLHNETSYFILANFMDLVMTGILLRYSAVEANPIANFFYLRYGFAGMLGLKIASVALVCFLAQNIASRSEIKAKILLIGGTLLVATVVVYSMFLARHQLSS